MYDHVFYSNPSDQIEEKLPILPDWTNLFLKEIIERVINKKKDSGTDIGAEGKGSSVSEIFSAFDIDGDEFVTRDEFAETLKYLGFHGEGSAAVIDEEIDAIMVRDACS